MAFTDRLLILLEPDPKGKSLQMSTTRMIPGDSFTNRLHLYIIQGKSENLLLRPLSLSGVSASLLSFLFYGAFRRSGHWNFTLIGRNPNGRTSRSATSGWSKAAMSKGGCFHPTAIHWKNSDKYDSKGPSMIERSHCQNPPTRRAGPSSHPKTFGQPIEVQEFRLEQGIYTLEDSWKWSSPPVCSGKWSSNEYFKEVYTSSIHFCHCPMAQRSIDTPKV